MAEALEPALRALPLFNHSPSDSHACFLPVSEGGPLGAASDRVVRVWVGGAPAGGVGRVQVVNEGAWEGGGVEIGKVKVEFVV